MRASSILLCVPMWCEYERDERRRREGKWKREEEFQTCLDVDIEQEGREELQ